MKQGVYVQIGEKRIAVESLAASLRQSLHDRIYMNPDRMEELDRVRCRWVGFGFGKGVTDPGNNVSVYAVPHTLERGLHAELVKGFPNIDPYPVCYENNHTLGFNSFVRWVYFADPIGQRDVFGVDWSLIARPTSGVANSMIRVAEVVRTAANHGVSLGAEVALLNWRMCEESFMEELRCDAGVWTVGDWIMRAEQVFGREGVRCPRCGLETRKEKEKYCFRCGCQPELIYNEWERYQGG